MNVPSIHSAVDPSKLTLAEMARNPNIPAQAKIAEVSRQFEAILLRQILQETRKTIFHSEFGSDSVISSIYQDMISNQLAESISRSGAFGLSRALNSELTRQLTGSAPPAEKIPPAQSAIRPTLTSQPNPSHE